MIQSLAYWVVLIVAATIHWRLPRRWRPGFVAATSAALLATVAPWVVLGLGVWTTSFALLLRREAWRKTAFVAFFTGLILQLALFKYLPPLMPSFFGADFLVPLGLSFFTFKLLHYGVEVLRGNLPAHPVSEVLAWIFLFPIFTAGPIERFDHFRDQAEPEWSPQATVEGITRIVHGLIKRFFLGEMVIGNLPGGEGPAVMLDRLDTLSSGEVWLFTILSFLRLYMDFSGYTDIAIGSARLFGYRIVENFNWPLLSDSPRNFWQRWHISLADWCRDYVFYPVFGRFRRPLLALYATFFVMGLWHDGSPHWILWGVYQGTGVAAHAVWTRLRKRRKWKWPDRKPFHALCVVATFLFICAAQSFTSLNRIAPIEDSFRVLGRLLFLPI